MISEAPNTGRLLISEDPEDQIPENPSINRDNLLFNILPRIEEEKKSPRSAESSSRGAVRPNQVYLEIEEEK